MAKSFLFWVPVIAVLAGMSGICSLKSYQTNESSNDRMIAVQNLERLVESNGAIPTPPPPLPTPGEGAPTPGFPFPGRDLAALTQPGSSTYQTALYVFLKGLQQQQVDLAGQSAVLLDPDGQVLAAFQPNQLTPTASMVPLAISVAAQDWGDLDSPCPIDVLMTGSIKDSTLHGDLWIETLSEPYFTEKDAANLVEKLNQQGIRRISGMVYISSSLLSTVPNNIGTFLLAQPNFSVDQVVTSTSSRPPANAQLILQTDTQATLKDILKSQTVYNLTGITGITEGLVAEMGGMSGFKETLEDYLDPKGFQLNDILAQSQFSAQSVVQLLMALDETNTLETLLPESGSDSGSLTLRNLPIGTYALSGATQGVASVAGQLPDGKFFVLLNQGSDFDTLRKLQDRFLQDVMLLDQPTR